MYLSFPRYFRSQEYYIPGYLYVKPLFFSLDNPPPGGYNRVNRSKIQEVSL